MTSPFNILGEGLMCTGTRRSIVIEEALQMFSDLLCGTSKAASFNALFHGIGVDWSLHEDVVNPLGDRRQALVTAYTFDLDHDLLLFSDATRHLQTSLENFRKERAVVLEDFAQFEPPSPPFLSNSAFLTPHWKPTRGLSARSFPFVKRALSDFGHQWRHILRRTYSNSTFRQFARAILCMVSLDLMIIEEPSRWLHTSQLSKRGPHVLIHDRPSWKPYEESLLHFGKIIILLDQDLENAMSLAQEDANKQTMTGDGKTESKYPVVYLLLSVRHVALCTADNQGFIQYTAPAPLFNGIDCPSTEAISLLLQALSYAFRPPPLTPIHKLPMELHNRILDNVSESPIEAARLGSLFELGSPFAWQRTGNSRRGGQIERLKSTTHRSDLTPVDSKIYFEVNFSGLAYR